MFDYKLIKKLRKERKVSAEDLGAILGVNFENIYKWEKGIKISDPEVYKKMEDWIFGNLENIPPVSDSKAHGGAIPDYRDEIILLLKAENSRLKKDLDISLGELRHNALLARSVAETNQQLLIEILAKQRKTDLETVGLEVGKVNGENYRKMKEESRFDGVHS